MKKRNIIIIILISVFVLVSCLLVIKYIQNDNIKKENLRKENLIKEIKSHCNKNVVTNKKATLYKKENNEYIKHGEINKNINLDLEINNIDENTKYFKIKGLDLYIDYKAVDKQELQEQDDRYNNYIYFNENITTKNITNFYDYEDNYILTINESFDFKVLVKDNNKYGVIYNNNLMYIKDSDVVNVYENKNADQINKERIRTLTYHFIYDPETQSCDQIICLTLEKFEEQLKYIRENNYFTLKLNELEMYLDGKIQIPEKSIVLTIDDGTLLNQKALELLEKYEVNATLFLITSWIEPSAYQSKYLDLESHTHNMHNQYECPGYGSQGGGILCLPEEKVLEDLKACQEKLGGSKYLAYPFFDFNDRAINLLKQAGYTMAFIGQYDSIGYSYPNKTDKYKVRRLSIFSSDTMDDFIDCLN